MGLFAFDHQAGINGETQQAGVCDGTHGDSRYRPQITHSRLWFFLFVNHGTKFNLIKFSLIDF